MLEVILKKLNAEERAFITNLIDKDSLTGIFNRSFFNKRIREEVHRSGRSGAPVSLVLLDIDNFKHYQDTHNEGHLEGDRILIEVAGQLKRGVRDYDVVCRYGGEEMAIICPESSLSQGMEIAERLRRRVIAECPVTISAGVASYPHISYDVRDLIHKADRALYLAKKSGRNQCRAYSQAS